MKQGGIVNKLERTNVLVVRFDASSCTDIRTHSRNDNFLTEISSDRDPCKESESEEAVAMLPITPVGTCEY